MKPTTPTPAVLTETEQLNQELASLTQTLRDAQQFRTLEEKIQDLKDEGRFRPDSAEQDGQD